MINTAARSNPDPDSRLQAKHASPLATDDEPLKSYLDNCRSLILEEITSITPETRHGRELYRLMLDYPLRGGKTLRPALCIATCRALGGHLEAVLRTAAVLELYHNAFLIHDDVEDGSALRRTEATLHLKYGVPIAVNVGDGMLALSMSPLLDNMEIIGVGRALRILQTIARMARESAEGQMMELDWIRKGEWTLRDQDYIRMVYKKTTWYTFITSVCVGAIGARAANEQIRAFARFATLLGIAFQIQDDVLNLVANQTHYGKEIGGDLWEGKHTLMLIHAMRSASASERERAERILQKPRPPVEAEVESDEFNLLTVLDDLRADGLLTEHGHTRLSEAVKLRRNESKFKSSEEVEFLRDLIVRYDGVRRASEIAERHVMLAARSFHRIAGRLAPSVHLDFLRDLVEFVIRRAY
jgi:geranylgeranyl diphosphate synthase type II